MPPGGDGFYYFTIYFYVETGEYGKFEVYLNGERLCTAEADKQTTPGDSGQTSCSATSQATAGLHP